MTGLASTANATTDATFTRVQGQSPNADRYGTSAEVADLFGTSTDVILASGEPGHTVDALSASVLAGFKKAPILLTKQAATPQVVLDQIKASGAKNVWLVGGFGVISSAQEQALRDAGYTVGRLSGADRWGTAADVINHSNKSTTALIATGLDFPDALGGGALSYAAGFPIGIVKKDSVPAETLAALKNAGVTQVIILGGTGAVSDQVVTQLAGEGITLKDRIGGVNRAETSTKLADYEIKNYGFTNSQANIASGYAFGDGADALGGAAFSGENKTPLLITKNVTQADELAKWLAANANTVAGGYVFGGPGAVADALVTQLQNAARGVTSNQSFTVTPNDSVTKTASADDTDNAGARQYSVSGLDPAKAYDIALFPSENVKIGSNGQVTLDPNTQLAVNTGVSIEVVNGVAQVAADTGAGVAHVNNVSPTAGGAITFTVDSVVEDSVTPVVFLDADNNNAVAIDATTKRPTESFGVGGTVTWTPGEAPIGTIAGVTPTSVNTAGDYFIAGGLTYNWDSNDTFQYKGITKTQAEFESLLSTGSTVKGVYSPTTSDVSTFNIDAQVAPAAAQPTATLTNADKGAYANDIKVEFTPAVTDPEGATYTLLRSTGGAYSEVTPSKSVASNGDVTWTDSNLADGDYYYEVKVTFPVSGATATSTNSPKVTVTAPKATKDGAPLSTAATFQDQDSNGVLSAGDVLRVTFDETMSAPASDASVELTDGDGTVATVTNGAGSTWALNGTNTYVITLSAAPVVSVAGGSATLAFGADVTDASGVQDTAASNTPAGALDWDFAGSADFTF